MLESIEIARSCESHPSMNSDACFIVIARYMKGHVQCSVLVLCIGAGKLRIFGREGGGVRARFRILGGGRSKGAKFPART